MLNTHYEKLLKKVQNSLNNAQAVCLTSDSWTDINNSSFLADTAHFIHENNCTLRSECDEFTDRHSAENIGQWIRSDPRFKQKGFDNESLFKDCCVAILEQMNILNPQINEANEEAVRSRIENVTGPGESIWEEFDLDLENHPEIMLNSRSSNAIELDNYVAEPLVHRSDDPLEW
uniref:DUF659 domain-containing protein n=1 Tax=Anopheles epiroticus TaxID=199890 RepID=A0A182PX34_9DIPT